MKQDLKEIDVILSKLRKQAGLSKKELAKKSGLHPISVANVENASVKDPRLSSIVKYLNACGYGLYIAPIVPAKAKIAIASVNSEMKVESSECVVSLSFKIVPE